MNVARMPQAWIDSTNNISIFDDFVNEALTTLTYSVTKDASMAVTVAGLGGILTIAGDTTDNDECYLFTQNDIFKPGAGYAIEAKCLMQYSEAATNAANVLFGLVSSPAADLLVDNGAGPRTSGTVIAIYKVDGGTVWRCVTRWGSSTSVLDTVSTTTAGGTAYQELAISVADGGSSGTSVVSFYVDGVQLKDSTGTPIIHYYPNASGTTVSLTAALKQGGTTAEALLLQKWMCSQSY
jgi:hypothetical protein